MCWMVVVRVLVGGGRERHRLGCRLFLVFVFFSGLRRTNSDSCSKYSLKREMKGKKGENQQ